MSVALTLLGSLLVAHAWGLPPPAAAQDGATAGSARPQAPIEALADGLDAALTKATDRLKTRRTEATSTLDAAMRVSEVASRGSPATFEEVHEMVKRARSSLQDGDNAGARAAIDEATQRLRAPVQAQSEPPQGLNRYAGATVIDRFGRRIGEVVAAAERDGRPMLRLALGTRDAAGAIDLGGRLVWVDAHDLVFGKVKPLGSTLVAWPGAPAS